MEKIGTYVIYILMFSAIIGGIAAIKNKEKGIGKEFMEGIHSIGYIFIPTAGIMASVPYLSQLIESVFGPLFVKLGADPSIAATSLIAVDMGGYQLAEALAQTKESWIMAMIIGYMAGATIVFSIPTGLAMLQKKDHKYMALGVMSGVLAIPIGVLVSCLLIVFTNPTIRSAVSTNSSVVYELSLSLGTIFMNLIPLIVFVGSLAIGLRFFPDKMIKGFMIFGRGLDAFLKLVLLFSIVEHFTGAFSTLFGSFGFSPIVADEQDQYRALEVAGYIGLMLAGAFPFVYLMQKYLALPLEKIGNQFGISKEGSAGILAASANILAMFRLVKDMPAKDKVMNISYAVCAAFLFGDHLSFTANFQPNLILYIMIGKFVGGASALVLAKYLSVPKAIELEEKEKKEESDIETVNSAAI